MNVTEKSKDFVGTFRKLIRYGKSYLPAIVFALLCAVAGTILTLVGPDQLSDMTNLITQGLTAEIDLDAVLSIGIRLVVIYLASALLTGGQNMIMARRSR